MKKKIYAIFICIMLFWIGSIGYSIFLTIRYGDEFVNFEKIGFDFMHPWEENPRLRVLTYSENKAEVYHFDENGGEKSLFVKEKGEWRFEKTLAIWSDYGGSADDYFIWPYFKHYVP